MRQEQQIRTGDAATDKLVVDEIRSSLEASGMRVTVESLAGGGFNVVTELDLPPMVVSATFGTTARTPSTSSFELGGPDKVALAERLRQGDFTSLCAFLVKSYADADWDDRAFMLDLLGKVPTTHAVARLVRSAPNDPHLRLFSGIHHIGKAWEARGTGTADAITVDGQAAMSRHVATAARELQAAAALAPADPTPLAFLVGVAQLDGPVDALAAFEGAIARDPANVAAYSRVVALTTEKWGGALDDCLSLARRGVRAAPCGSDLPHVIFRAHVEAWFNRQCFCADPAAARAYVALPQVRTELEAAFDAWAGPAYAPRRSSVVPLHWAAAWFFIAGDRPRMKRALQLTNYVPPPQYVPWVWISDVAYTQAMQAASS